ncbi:FAD binding domain-containing protein [Jiangella endophytica]|uniref:FAD binding domain-containing protein n=1 Tax=Jiangella endophytica TaxID=1623398 RepID=UPI000E353AEE|nr:FAD binding domain-containing protein [Jiangella endophytica]
MDLTTVREFRRLAGRDDVGSWRTGDAYLAGGTWLLSEPQPSVRRLVDVTAPDWPALEVSPDGLEISATCTLARLAAAAGDPAPSLRGPGRTGGDGAAPAALPAGWTVAPLIRDCVDALVASFKIWHLATVGGNVCLALPAGSMISLLTALDATTLVWRAGGVDERVPVAGLVTGYGVTALGPGDLVRSFHIGVAALRATTAFARASLSPRGRSAAVVIARRDEDGSVTVSVTAATPHPYVLRFDRPPGEREFAAAARSAIGDDYTDDVYGAPDWRRHLVAVLGARALTRLARRPAP